MGDRQKVSTDIECLCGGVAEVETGMLQLHVEGDDTGEMGFPKDYEGSYWICEGDPAVCRTCGATGTVECDGENSWVDWAEDVIEEDDEGKEP